MKRNRFWLVGLMLLTALVLIIWSPFSQTTIPTHTPTLKGGATGTKPACAGLGKTFCDRQILPAALATTPTESFSLGGTYQDPARRFQVGILEGYNISSVGASPLFSSPDGNLAYTVVVRSRSSSRPLTAATLAQIAIDTFRRGEGFIPDRFRPLVPGRVQVPWTGSLTMGGNTQPMNGMILVSQPQQDILMLLISATQTGRYRVDTAVATLADTFKPKESRS
ncbi:MAG: hypothetical protein GDA43_21850 [Hormoscilla sp. SP5CHS1]|nr:hypothetical protein [Hormoscilla sp. SP5CHS1]